MIVTIRAARPPDTSDNFTIFEGTSEIQRLIIGRAVTASTSGSPELRN